MDSTPGVDFVERSAQTFGRGLSFDDPVPFLGFSPVMGESQKVERTRFLWRFTLRTGLSRAPERHQPRLLRVETQTIFLKPLEEDSINLLRITLMREAQHHIISESHRENPTCHSLLYHFREPAVEYFV
jgi:hypothetical protein